MYIFFSDGKKEAMMSNNPKKKDGLTWDDVHDMQNEIEKKIFGDDLIDLLCFMETADDLYTGYVNRMSEIQAGYMFDLTEKPFPYAEATDHVRRFRARLVKLVKDEGRDVIARLTKETDE